MRPSNPTHNTQRIVAICILGFLLGMLFGCTAPTGPCADSTIRTDTIGWVTRLDGTLAPITATAPKCIGFE